MSARLTVFPVALARELAERTLAARTDIAEQIAEQAIAAAPVRTGYFKSQIDVETSGNRVFVVDSADDAVFIEYGTLDTDPSSTLTDAARGFGRYSGWMPR